jgi:hypothetical protein
MSKLKPSLDAENSPHLPGGMALKMNREQLRTTDNVLAALWVGAYWIILMLFRTLRRVERAAS